MISATKEMFHRAFQFSGRTSRGRFWLAYLGELIIGAVIGIVYSVIAVMIGLIFGDSNLGGILIGITSILIGLFSLYVCIASLSMTVRRFHDTGKSGWLVLVCILGTLICFIGAIVEIVILVTDGDQGNNQYGPDPDPKHFNSMGGMGYNNYQQGYNNYTQNFNNQQGYGNNYQQGMNNQQGYNNNDGWNNNNGGW